MKNNFKPLVLVFSVIIIFLFLPLISAGQLNVTQEHPFLINGSWIEAKDLREGDLLQTSDGKNVRITNIKDVEVPENESVEVYNLEAGIYHDFVVCGDKDCNGIGGVGEDKDSGNVTGGEIKENNVDGVGEDNVGGSSVGVVVHNSDLVHKNDVLHGYHIYTNPKTGKEIPIIMGKKGGFKGSLGRKMGVPYGAYGFDQKNHIYLKQLGLNNYDEFIFLDTKNFLTISELSSSAQTRTLYHELVHYLTKGTEARAILLSKLDFYSRKTLYISEYNQAGKLIGTSKFKPTIGRTLKESLKEAYVFPIEEGYSFIGFGKNLQGVKNSKDLLAGTIMVSGGAYTAWKGPDVLDSAVEKIKFIWVDEQTSEQEDQ
jgi:hypothetical protein